MSDHVALTDGPVTANNNAAPAELPGPSAASLEQRVSRLEDAVAQLQDTRLLEERVVERLAACALSPPPPAPPPEAVPVSIPQTQPQAQPQPAPDPAAMIMNAGHQLLPVAADVLRSDPAASPIAVPRAVAAGFLKRSWLLQDMYTELRSMVYMFIDPRYTLTWTGRVVPLVLVIAIFTSFIWFPGISTLYTLVSAALGMTVMKLVDLVMAYFLFKVLSREAARYRETSPNLPPRFRT
jgi:hypothetical protein